MKRISGTVNMDVHFNFYDVEVQDDFIMNEEFFDTVVMAWENGNAELLSSCIDYSNYDEEVTTNA